MLGVHVFAFQHLLYQKLVGNVPSVTDMPIFESEGNSLTLKQRKSNSGCTEGS